MPAILTHYTFALEAITPEDLLFRDVVNLGSQGPDTFMAYGSIPWRKRPDKKKVQQWGHTMHSLPVGDVYLKMVEYAKGSPDKDLLFAYIDGLLMHFSVDRIFHAYIFYRSGFDQAGRLQGYWSWSHGFFEAILDLTFGKRKGTYGPLYRCIKSDRERVEKISAMWSACSPAHLGLDDFTRSYEDFVSAEKMLYNRLGIKRPLFRLLGKYSTPYSQCHPRFPKKFAVLDVENNGHAVWHDPVTDEGHDESVDDMFAKALHDYAEVHEILSRARNGEDIAAEFREWTRNLDHNGAPIGEGKRTHMSLCWEALGEKKLLP